MRKSDEPPLSPLEKGKHDQRLESLAGYFGKLNRAEPSIREHFDKLCSWQRPTEIDWTAQDELLGDFFASLGSPRRLGPRTDSRHFVTGKVPRRLTVETSDLLNDCPVWRNLAGKSDAILKRIQSIRRKWSRQKVEVLAPVDLFEILPLESQTIWQLCSYSWCLSTAFWPVAGPAALLADLQGIAGSAVPEEPLAMFLCQHEITGD